MEHGFSIYKNALAENMQMEITVAQRKINEYMRKINFQPHMLMSKVLLQNAKQPHFRYKKPWMRSKIKRIRKALGLSK